MKISDPIIQVENLSFSYGSVPVFSNISFSVARGSYVVIAGANGSGKSTLARCIAGVLNPCEGRIITGGNPGIVFQSPSEQIVADIAQDDTAFGPSNMGFPHDELVAAVTENLDLVSLLDYALSATATFSPGMKQRLVLAGILAMSPSLLILDESCSMIDPVGRKKLLDFVDTLHCKGITVLHITHDMDEAMRAERVLVLHGGSLVFDGAPSALFAMPDIAQWSLSLPSVHACIQVAASVLPCFDCAADCTPEEYADAFVRCCPDACDVPVFNPAATQRTAAVTLSDVSFTYSGANHAAVNHVSHTFYAGSVTAVIGRTGSGKSTLMQLASGLLTPLCGSVTVPPLSDKPLFVSGAAVLPYCVQEPESSVFCQFAGDDASFGPRNQGYAGKQLVRRTACAMDKVGLPFKTFCDRPVYEMSGGERRKLGLAGIVAIDSPVYFFDEPSMGLDPAGRRSLFACLRELADAGAAVIFSTHRLEEAAAADEVLCMTGGSIADVGKPAAVFAPGGRYKTDVPWIVQTAVLIYQQCGGIFPVFPEDFAACARALQSTHGESGCSEKDSRNNCPADDLHMVDYCGDAEQKAATPAADKQSGTVTARTNDTAAEPAKGTKWLTALHPVAKYIMLFAFLVSAVSRDIPLLMVTIVFNAVILAAAHLPVSNCIKTICSVIPFLFVVSLLHILVFPVDADSHVYVSWHFIVITERSIHGVIVLFLNFLAMMLPLWTFVQSTPRTALMDGITGLLYPLGCAGVPIEHAGLLFMMVFRFVPLLHEELDRIVMAQRSRGSGALNKKTFLSKVRTVVPLVVPLTVRTLRKAEAMAEAVTARRYGYLRSTGAKGKKALRTSYYVYRIRMIDIVLPAVCVMYAAAVLTFPLWKHYIW